MEAVLQLKEKDEIRETYSGKAHSNDGSTEEQGRRRRFRCRYCNKGFYNSQALGGHQNAHKREKAIEREGKSTIAAIYRGIGNNMRPPLYPYLSMAGLPIDGSFMNRNSHLGVRLKAMFHNPRAHLASSMKYGYIELSPPATADYTPAVSVFADGQFRMEKNYLRGGGIARCNAPMVALNLMGVDLVDRKQQVEAQELDLTLRL